MKTTIFDGPIFTKKIISVWILSVLGITLPYLYAFWPGEEKLVFMGFLLNPMDGYSYIAKMYQGWQGNWTFSLPFTLESGDRSFLFFYYILLGQMSRILNVDLLLFFHITRVINFILLLFSITRFFYWIFPKDKFIFETAVILASVGSGLGWLLLPFGYITADFWVAEAYPFLSGYANPHFTLGMTLMLCIFMNFLQENMGKGHYVMLVLSGCALAIVYPFGILIIGLVIISYEIVNGVDKRKIRILHLLFLGIGSGPILIFQYFQVKNNPLLSVWNSQNITSTPPVWDIFISFSPLLLFAVWGWYQSKSDKGEGKIRFLQVWGLVGIILIFLPLDLQRRFIAGYYLPLSGLAAIGLGKIGRPRLNMIVLAMSIITNGLLITMGIYSINTHSDNIFLHKTDMDALNWIKYNTPSDAAILASPDIGLVIPGFTGRKVIYGHPFETPNAHLEKENVTRWYNGSMDRLQADRFILEKGIDYIYFGPREKELGEGRNLARYQRVYSNGDVQILSTQIEKQ